MGSLGTLLARHRIINRLLAASLLCLAFAQLAMAEQRTQAPILAAPAPARIFVVRRGWHVDLGFAAADVGAALAPVGAEFPGARYLLFGFGDAKCLLARRLGPPVLLGALWPGRGLLLVTGLAVTPEEAFGGSQVIELEVSRARLQAAQDFVQRSLAEQPPAPLQRGPYEGSLFYRSSARYSAVHTCNTWAAEGLKAAGFPVRSTGVWFAAQLWRQARRARTQQVP